MPGNPRIKVLKDKDHVYISISGHEYRLSPKLAREVGSALYKTGCDVEQHGTYKEST